VYTYEQTLEDPQVKARRMVIEVDHPKIGRMKAMGHPVKSTGAIASVRMPAPLLGQHTAAVLTELGLSRTEIDALFAQSVVYDSTRAG